MGNSQTGRLITTAEILPKEQQFGALHWTPQPWVVQWGDELPQCLVFKVNRAYFKESQGAVGNGDSTLKRLTENLTHFRTQGRSSYLKGIWIRPTLILESLQERQEAIRAHLGDTDTGGRHFGELILPCGQRFCKWYCGLLPLVY